MQRNGIAPTRLARLSAGLLMVAAVLMVAPDAQAQPMRVKDLGKLQGWRENALVGYGIVTGLAGTGDSSSNRTTRQAVANTLAQFNLTVPPDQVQSRNVALVTVTASLPTFAREGDAIDITVASAGDARSLVGGTLLMTPLKGPDGRTYALAQGAVSVGGYRYDANGNVMQKNHPTVGSIPGGAVVEVSVTAQTVTPEQIITFVLAEPDYTTANRIAQAINTQVGAGLAEARDASGVEIRLPDSARQRPVPFLSRLESVTVEPDRRARVVINERTGTVVSGGDVRISRVAISHGDLKIAISTFNAVSQPNFIGVAGPGVRTAVVGNTRVQVDELEGPSYVPPTHHTVDELVQALARLKTNTRDMISILRAVKAAGALHGELVIQ